MNTRREFIEVLSERLSALPESEAKRLLTQFVEMLDDRLEMGMSEADAVSALGNVDQLIRDYAPAALVPVSDTGSGHYNETIAEIRLHVRNADAVIVNRPLPEGMTAQITASEANTFTWSLEDGVLTLQEAGEARRGLFRREREITLTLSDCRPAKLIADSYGGDIEVKGLSIGELAVLMSSSGDIEMTRCAVGGRTELTTRSGNLKLKDVDVRGDCKLEAMSGDIEVKRVSAASLRLRAASGDIEGDGIHAGTAALGTTSGDIEVSDIAAQTSILCETASGDIALSVPQTPDLRLSTASGDISLRLPGCPEGYDLQADSRAGDVDLPRLPLPGEQPRRVQALSASGDIRILVK